MISIKYNTIQERQEPSLVISCEKLFYNINFNNFVSGKFNLK
jgi:hypothetical protein